MRRLKAKACISKDSECSHLKERVGESVRQLLVPVLVLLPVLLGPPPLLHVLHPAGELVTYCNIHRAGRSCCRVSCLCPSLQCQSHTRSRYVYLCSSIEQC